MLFRKFVSINRKCFGYYNKYVKKLTHNVMFKKILTGFKNTCIHIMYIYIILICVYMTKTVPLLSIRQKRKDETKAFRKLNFRHVVG